MLSFLAEHIQLVLFFIGGTLDVTAHEILTNGNIKEVHQVTGGPHGGTKVDEEFVSLLKKFFGNNVVEIFREKYPGEWLELMNEFEMKKRGRRASEGETTRIRLSRTFTSLVSEHGGHDLAERFASSCAVDDVKFVRNEYFCLGSMAMKTLFDPVIKGIVEHLKNLLKSRALKRVKFFFLVGGFAESVLLQEAIKKQFSSQFTILVPNNAGIAVVQGAVLFGQRPGIIASRQMSTTYGIEAWRLFDGSIHPINKKEELEGVNYCKDCLSVLVKEGEVIQFEERRHFTYSPITSGQTSFEVEFYTSSNPNAKFTTDPEVGPSIGKVTVSSPDISKGKDREIRVCLYFGGTEINATVIDVTSQNTGTASLDFLYKHT